MKGSNYATVIMMTFVLIVIVGLMLVIHHLQRPLSKTPLEMLSSDAAMIGHRYYNRSFRCVVSLPDTVHWRANFRTAVDTSQFRQKSASHPLPLVRLIRSQDDMIYARVDISVFPAGEQLTLQEFTHRHMMKALDSLHRTNQVVTVIGDVKVVSSLNLAGAFYVLELAAPTLEPFPVWVRMFVLKDDRFFSIFAQCKRAHYDYIKSEIEYILINFQLL